MFKKKKKNSINNKRNKTTKNAWKGEKYARRAIEVLPEFVGGYALLIRILFNSQRMDEIEPLVEVMLQMPHPAKEMQWSSGVFSFLIPLSFHFSLFPFPFSFFVFLFVQIPFNIPNQSTIALVTDALRCFSEFLNSCGRRHEWPVWYEKAKKAQPEINLDKISQEQEIKNLWERGTAVMKRRLGFFCFFIPNRPLMSSAARV